MWYIMHKCRLKSCTQCTAMSPVYERKFVGQYVWVSQNILMVINFSAPWWETEVTVIISKIISLLFNKIMSFLKKKTTKYFQVAYRCTFKLSWNLSSVMTCTMWRTCCTQISHQRELLAPCISCKNKAFHVSITLPLIMNI